MRTPAAGLYRDQPPFRLNILTAAVSLITYQKFRSLADLLTEKYDLTSKILLSTSVQMTAPPGFKERMKVAGIEPTDAADVANADGIRQSRFINKKSVKEITDKYGKAKIVTATNVFAHINNMAELIPNIKDLMAEDGVFVSESQYLMDIAEKSAFDTIYHDHLRYYSLKPLEYLFNSFGCTLVDAERITAAGGSIRAFAMKGKQKQSKRVKELIKQEEEMGIYDVKFWSKFRTQAVEAKMIC